jgi:hypothetical protein
MFNIRLCPSTFDIHLHSMFVVCLLFVSTHEPPCKQWLAAVGQVLCCCWSFPH